MTEAQTPIPCEDTYGDHLPGMPEGMLAVSLLWLVSGANQRSDGSCSTLGANQGTHAGDTLPPQCRAERPRRGRRRSRPRSGDASPGPSPPALPLYKSAAGASPLIFLRCVFAGSPELSGRAPASARRCRSPRPSPALSVCVRRAFRSQRRAALSPPAAPAAYGPGRRRCRRLYFCCRFPHSSLKIPPKKRRRFTKSFGPLSHVSTRAGSRGSGRPWGGGGGGGDAHPELRAGPGFPCSPAAGGSHRGFPVLRAVQGGTGSGGCGARKGGGAPGGPYRAVTAGEVWGWGPLLPLPFLCPAAWGESGRRQMESGGREEVGVGAPRARLAGRCGPAVRGPGGRCGTPTPGGRRRAEGQRRPR